MVREVNSEKFSILANKTRNETFMCPTSGTATSKKPTKSAATSLRLSGCLQYPNCLLITTKKGFMQSKTFIALALLTAILGACKKEEKQDNPVSKAEYLTSGLWLLTAYTLSPAVDFDGDGDLDTDALALFEPYNKDDLFRFKAEGTIEIDEGPTKALATDPQIKTTTTWAFADNETVLVIDGSRAALQELTASKLRFKLSVAGSTGEMTFTKQ
jgi:hypothetical protein